MGLRVLLRLCGVVLCGCCVVWVCGFAVGFGLMFVPGVACLIYCFLRSLLFRDLFWVFVVWCSGCGGLWVGICV